MAANLDNRCAVYAALILAGEADLAAPRRGCQRARSSVPRRGFVLYSRTTGG